MIILMEFSKTWIIFMEYIHQWHHNFNIRLHQPKDNNDSWLLTWLYFIEAIVTFYKIFYFGQKIESLCVTFFQWVKAFRATVNGVLTLRCDELLDLGGSIPHLLDAIRAKAGAGLTLHVQPFQVLERAGNTRPTTMEHHMIVLIYLLDYDNFLINK